ncbi:MAG: GAF domain-containing protein [Anaerolineales bacterium]|nr:GAF domain-containing protein [Anaerolineales bacterium]
MSDNERIQRLERLLEVSRNLSASLDLEPFLQSVLSVASELTNSEVASILEVKDDEQLRFLAVPWFHRESLQTVSVPIETSVAGWVYRNAKPAVVADVAAEPRHFKGVDRVAQFETRSIMAVPIVYKGEALGVLETVNKVNQANYTEEDLIILETLASQVAVAMQNGRLMSHVRKAVDEVDHLDRMKSDFIAVASHELRTPLGLILGHSTFLREVIQTEYQPQLDTIVRNAMRLKEIIDNIANMDNVERGVASVRRRTVSIRKVAQEVLENFSAEVQKKRISLQADLGKDELMIEGDASKIATALTNLVKNAILFSDAGGHIFVIAEQIPGYVKVSVIDDGIGIPTKDLGRIFERFYQVESHLTRKHGGMGLGLSVAKVMIEMHGGRIWAESVEGKGSNFTFILPLDSGQADAAKRVFAS